MAIENYYTTITKRTKSKVANGRGGYTYTWTSIGTFQGVINQSNTTSANSAERLAEKPAITTIYNLYCAVGTSLAIDDFVYYNNQNYRVTSIAKNTMNKNHHLKYTLEKVSLDG